MDDHKLQMLHSSGSCDHRTPPALYEKLSHTWRFDLDLAATLESCLVLTDDPGGVQAHYLGPDHPIPAFQDALVAPWHEIGKVGFLNPPYSLSLYSDGLAAGVPRADLQWLLVENWAKKAYDESVKGFTTVGVFPYAAQTEWFRRYVMGHVEKPVPSITDPKECTYTIGWAGHAALDYWRIPHRVSFLRGDGQPQVNSNVNTCIVIWGPNPGFVGPWVPSGRYWSYR